MECAERTTLCRNEMQQVQQDIEQLRADAAEPEKHEVVVVRPDQEIPPPERGVGLVMLVQNTALFRRTKSKATCGG